MASKFVQHLSSESLIDFAKEVQESLDAENAKQLKEVEALLFRNGDLARQANKQPAVLEEKLTRKHFQMAADTLKQIADKAKRKELANHHAETFKKANPRFDRARFMKAAGVEESVITKGKPLNEAQDAHDVYLKGKKIDTVFANPGAYNAEEMKKSLVNHDGYHPDITVKTRKSKPAPKK